MSDYLLKRLTNKVIVETLITELSERKLNSTTPEYYNDAINIIKTSEPGTIVIALLGMKYHTKEICEILGCDANHVNVMKYRLANNIRKQMKGADVNSSLLPYYLGLLDIDTWMKGVSDV